MEDKVEDLTKQITEAIESEAIPKFYVNGFVNAYHLADIIVIFKRNGRNEIALNMSYTTAKSFAEKLTTLINDFEKKTGHEIMTIDVIKDKIKRANKEKTDG